MHYNTTWFAPVTSLPLGFALLGAILLAGTAPAALADGSETRLSGRALSCTWNWRAHCTKLSSVNWG